MLGPDAAIALVRDQNPVRLEKVRYFADRGLRGLSQKQALSQASFPELPNLPEASLPGAVTHQEVPKDGKEGSIEGELPLQPDSPEDTEKKAGLVSIRGKQDSLGDAVKVQRFTEKCGVIQATHLGT